MNEKEIKKRVFGERRPPHWIEVNSRPKSFMWKCSRCGRVAYDMPMCGKIHYKKICMLQYCPHCGVMMDLSDSEIYINRSREENERD